MSGCWHDSVSKEESIHSRWRRGCSEHCKASTWVDIPLPAEGQEVIDSIFKREGRGRKEAYVHRFYIWSVYCCSDRSLCR